MPETQITFRREGLEGVIPTGSYLLDAAKRFGVRFEDVCRPDEDVHFCAVVVADGAENMSPLTKAESEHFAAHERKTDERLACQAKIETPGDIVIMTAEKEETAADAATPEEQSEQYKKEFTELPLEKKIAALVQLEAIALGETVSFIFNSPYLVFDKMMDVMAEFGLRKEEQSKKAGRPKEHATADGEAGKAGSQKKGTKKNSEPAAETGQ
jgi:ferredoxin